MLPVALHLNGIVAEIVQHPRRFLTEVGVTGWFLDHMGHAVLTLLADIGMCAAVAVVRVIGDVEMAVQAFQVIEGHSFFL